MEFLHDFGSSALLRFWLPVGIWTLLAPLSLLLARRMSAHPYLQLKLRYAVLTSLPAGILLLNLIPQAPSFLIATPIHDWLIVVGDDAVRVNPVDATDFGWSWYAALGLLTVGVMLASIVGWMRHAANHIALHLYRSNNLKPAPEALQLLALDVASEMNIKQPFRLMLASRGTVPHTFGWRRAVIVLPEDTRDELASRLILSHELTHIRRGDFAAQYAEQLVKATFNFHPMVHRLVRDLHRYRELSCDADVIGMRPDLVKSYASLLLDFVGTPAQPKPSVVLSMATSSKHIQERIQTMKTSYPTSTRFSAIMPIALFVLISGILTLGRITSNQPPPPPPPPDAPVPEVFVVVERMPEPIGGLKAIHDRVVYPEIAKKAGIEGRVVVEFIVDEQGNVTEPRVLRGIGGGCDEAALDAIKATKFTPGMQRGRPVKVQFQIPIVFRLPTEEGRGLDGAQNPSGISVQQRRIQTDAASPFLRGHIVDSRTKDPLIGANIGIRRSGETTQKGAATNGEGKFVVNLSEAGKYTVRVTYVGYAITEFELEIGAKEGFSVDVAMSIVSVELDEIERN
jgi:TonB family protein